MYQNPCCSSWAFECDKNNHLEFASEIKTCHLSEVDLLKEVTNKICYYRNTDSDSAQWEEHFKHMQAYCMSYIEAEGTMVSKLGG